MKASKLAGTVAVESHTERATRQLTALCRATGLEGREGDVIGLFKTMSSPWADRAIGLEPEWSSDVCDDHTPYEFSFVLGEEPELRMLVEALGDEPSHESNWAAGRALSQRLAQQFDITLERLHAIEEIFAPGPGSKLAIWHAASFFKRRGPEFKIYFDAQAQGLGRAGALLEKALARLGFGDAWTRVAAAARRGSDLDEYKYLSLDLAKTADSRVKLYVRHKAATLSDMEAILGEAGAMPAGEASAFCRAIAGTKGPFSARPLFTCTTLTSGNTSGRVRRTLYVPISAYVNNDAEALERVGKCLRDRGLDAAGYAACISAFASGRPLSERLGLHSYVSLRYDSARPRVTVYVSPESYHMREAVQMESGEVPLAKESKLAPATEIVRRYEEEIVLADHPLFQRLAREPVNMGFLWAIMANFWQAIVHDFPSLLAQAIAKIENDEVRSIIVKQLNDELGEGDFSRAHKAMFKRLVAALEPYRMKGDDAAILAPGRRFGQRLRAHVLSSDPWESVGALMMVEIYGSQVDICVGKEFRRQKELNPSSMTWLDLHETLEVDHAGDSLRLAKLVPDGAALESTWRGATSVVAASQEYLSGLYSVCFS
ncbi:MAG TPA: iron-containing redox enzyme family protein [Polyangiaceae bacterium]|jgi:DMATS type aromatic prenyltransferase|nr:iron-containing redox enzyme family protein [Polyangiaceae bacterium]